MISKAQARELINGLFEEEALAFGGLVAVHQIDDDVVWHWVRSLDAIRMKALHRLDVAETYAEAGGMAPQFDLHPHPAIQSFLLKVRGIDR